VKRFFKRHWGKLTLLAALAIAPLSAHFWIRRAARLVPPHVTLPSGHVTRPRSGLRVFGDSYVTRRGGILEVRLVGKPSTIGYEHSRLLYPEMVKNEGIVWRLFRKKVSSSAARLLLLDLAELRYRHVDRDMSLARRQEIAGGALGFQPDPYNQVFPTYQRFVYLNALYDISLSFEHSPLIGCTTFVLSGAAAKDAHTLLARNFDFDAADIFDTGKAVFLVREAGKIPFASVAWPGLVGVVSGMNASGVALVVHGARAGTPRAVGEPVEHALRRVLETAHTTDEAVRALAERPPMVSHIVIIADASGKSVAVERVPGQPNFVHALGDKAVVTNHFFGPAKTDPKNLWVRAHTSTLARYARGQELLNALDHPASVADAVALLRDRKGVGGTPLPLGDRKAIDALIATHSVVMDATARVLWVSEAPHGLGRFVAFDLKRLLDPNYDPASEASDGREETSERASEASRRPGGTEGRTKTERPVAAKAAPDSAPVPLETIPADRLLTSGEYARWRKAHPRSGP
jgi:isopenicillin-N N-acyltransferase like protein